MTWLEQRLGADARWSDDGNVDWLDTVDEPTSGDPDEPSGTSEHSVLDVFDSLPTGSVSPGATHDVFAAWAEQLRSADFAESADLALIDPAETDTAQPLAGLLGLDDPLESLGLETSAPTDSIGSADDITSLADDSRPTSPIDDQPDAHDRTSDGDLPIAAEHVVESEVVDDGDLDHPGATGHDPLDDVVGEAIGITDDGGHDDGAGSATDGHHDDTDLLDDLDGGT